LNYFPNRRALFLVGIFGLVICGIAAGAQSASATAPPAPDTAYAALRAGFESPPDSAKLRCYWWWLNGNTTEATIDRDLTAMQRKGFAGVLLVDGNGSNQEGNANVPPGPMFGSHAWVRLYLHALQVAGRLHLDVSLNIVSGWNLGGPYVKPDEASKLLTWSRTVVADGRTFNGALPMPATKNGFYRQIAVLAYPLHHGAGLPGRNGDTRPPIRSLKYKTASVEAGFSMPKTEYLLLDAPTTPGEQDTGVSEVTDITAKVSTAGQLRWQAPSRGAWEILRIGYTDSDARVSTSSGAWQGLAIDYLDRGAFDTYWDRTIAPLLNVARPYLGTTLVTLATDSWEVGGTNWTGRFATEFRARRGYDPIPFLPVVAGRIVDDRATSDRFLNDLRRTVADLITDHYDHFAERAKAYGLGTQCESGGPQGAPVDALETFRSSAMTQTEFWAQSDRHRTTDESRFFVKEAASAANIYGKPLVAEEGMTSIGPQWSESLATDLKPTFDRAITEGMNRLVWHSFTSEPRSFGLPGNEYFAGTHLNPNVTWWNQSDAFFLYLNRTQFLMQQGHAVNDVLYLYGDEAPNFVRLKADDPARVLPGYDYDVTNEDALLHSLKVREGGIVSPMGNAYKLLVLPRSRRLSLEALERIAAYLKQGGAVAGRPPLEPAGNVAESASRHFSKLTEAIWAGLSAGEHRGYGKGTVFNVEDGQSALALLQVAPDFEDSTGRLDYLHRSDGVRDIYFIRNGSARAVDADAVFRIAGSTPELWNPLDGSISAPASYAADAGRTKLPLHLAPFGSIAVVFAQPKSDGGKIVPSADTVAMSNSSIKDLPAVQWTIQFQTGRGAPAGIRKLQAFDSWSGSNVAGVRYFAGTAKYRTTVDLVAPHKGHVFLTLTDVHAICTVRINGKKTGTIWAMPYRLEITHELVDGKNSIELDVTNLWPNRIIGDAQPDAAARYTHTNIREYTAASPLLPSGLIGPVRLLTEPASEELQNGSLSR
jgi:hypothetical protein